MSGDLEILIRRRASGGYPVSGAEAFQSKVTLSGHSIETTKNQRELIETAFSNLLRKFLSDWEIEQDNLKYAPRREPPWQV
jgi:hypothetical protein